MNDSANSSQSSSVLCLATKDTAIRLFIAAAMFIGFGIYCYTDWDNPDYAKPEVWDMKHINDIGGYLLTHYGPFVLIPPGLVLIILGILSLRRKLAADDEGIGYLGKDKLAWSEITALDASDLKSKQILRLSSKKGKTLVLDGYKLQNFKALVAMVDEHVSTGEGDTSSPDS